MKELDKKDISFQDRFERNRNIVSKSIVTILFATFMFYGKVQQLQGVPAEHGYFAVRHSFDNGLLFLIALLGLLGLYVSFARRHMGRGKAPFLIIGSGLWSAYAGLFLYRDLLFPHPPSLQTVLVFAIAISFWIDVKAGDF